MNRFDLIDIVTVTEERGTREIHVHQVGLGQQFTLDGELLCIKTTQKKYAELRPGARFFYRDRWLVMLSDMGHPIPGLLQRNSPLALPTWQKVTEKIPPETIVEVAFVQPVEKTAYAEI